MKKNLTRSKKSQSRFLCLLDLVIKLKNWNIKNAFSIFKFPLKIEKWNLKKFYHFSIFNFEVKIEMRKNVLFHFNFKMKIEWFFWCMDFFWIYFDLKPISKNENQKLNFKNSFIFQFGFWNWKMKNGKFSKFVLFLNQKANYTFGARIRIESVGRKGHSIFVLKWNRIFFFFRVSFSLSNRKKNFKS